MIRVRQEGEGRLYQSPRYQPIKPIPSSRYPIPQADTPRDRLRQAGAGPIKPIPPPVCERYPETGTKVPSNVYVRYLPRVPGCPNLVPVDEQGAGVRPAARSGDDPPLLRP